MPGRLRAQWFPGLAGQADGEKQENRFAKVSKRYDRYEDYNNFDASTLPNQQIASFATLRVAMLKDLHPQGHHHAEGVHHVPRPYREDR